MNPTAEHLMYDIDMAERSLALLKNGVGDRVLRNALHAACTVYIHNLLSYAGTDHNAFKQKADDQVRTLTSRRAVPQREKLYEPDYEAALHHAVNTLLDLGFIQKATR